MATTQKTPPKKNPIDSDWENVLSLLLKKVNLNKKELVEMKVKEWIVTHTHLLTPEEKKRFKNIVIR